MISFHLDNFVVNILRICENSVYNSHKKFKNIYNTLCQVFTFYSTLTISMLVQKQSIIMPSNCIVISKLNLKLVTLSTYIIIMFVNIQHNYCFLFLSLQL